MKPTRGGHRSTRWSLFSGALLGARAGAVSGAPSGAPAERGGLSGASPLELSQGLSRAWVLSAVRCGIRMNPSSNAPRCSHSDDLR
eukprot:11774693-Alexandrium_andersonii.AAC.1